MADIRGGVEGDQGRDDEQGARHGGVLALVLAAVYRFGCGVESRTEKENHATRLLQ